MFGIIVFATLLAQVPESFSAVEAQGKAFVKRDRSEERESVQERANWERNRRWPYSKDVPVERYATARKQIARMPKAKVAAPRFAAAKNKAIATADGGQWDEVGPSNVGGRTRAIVINPQDPNIMYAAGVSGGVFKSTDAGKSWKPLMDTLDNLAVSTLAMDPKDPETLYAGTGEYWASVARGVGIFKTTDGGASWTYLESTANSRFHYMHKIVVSPNDSRRIYAATWSGIVRSLDAGETWTLVVNRVGPNFGCADVTIGKNGDSDQLVAACMGPFRAPVMTAFRTQAGELDEAWENVLEVPGMWRATLSVAPSNPETIYLLGTWGAGPDTPTDRTYAFQAIYRTTQSGAKDSWERRSHSADGNAINSTLLSRTNDVFGDVCTVGGRTTWGNQGDYDMVIAVDPANADRVWVGGIDLFRSEDGGKSFGIASYWWLPGSVHADQHVIVFHPKYDGATNRTMYVGNDGGVYRSDNALLSVSTSARAACSPLGVQMRFVAINEGFAVTQFHAGAIYPGGHAYLGGSQDNGTNTGFDTAGSAGWFQAMGGDGGVPLVNPKDANILYVAVQSGSAATWFRRSTDNGYNYRTVMAGIEGPFNAVNFGFFTPHLLDPKEPNRVYLGGRTVWRSENSGDAWRPAAAAFEGAGVSTAMAIHPSDSNRILVGTTLGFIYRSNAALASNREVAWERARPRFGNVASIAFDPSNPDVAYAVYSTFNRAADRGHIFKTSDGGASWEAMDSGVPDLPFSSIAVNPSNPNLLYAGSDMGLFLSEDGGANWMVEDSNLPGVPVYQLVLSENNGPVLFAFTYGRGLFRRRLSADAPCTYAITGPAAVVAYGGVVAARINTANGCPWSGYSVSGGRYFTLPTSAGSGPGALNFSASINDTTLARGGTFQVGNTSYRVTQAAPFFPVLATAPTGATRINAVPYVSIQDTRPAAVNSENPVHSCTRDRDSKAVWFTYTATSTGRLTIQARGSRYDNGLSYGTVIAVYERNATTGEPGAELACVAQTAGEHPAFIGTPFTPTQIGQQVLIQVSARGAASPGGYTVLAIGQ